MLCTRLISSNYRNSHVLGSTLINCNWASQWPSDVAFWYHKIVFVEYIVSASLDGGLREYQHRRIFSSNFKDNRSVPFVDCKALGRCVRIKFDNIFIRSPNEHCLVVHCWNRRAHPILGCAPAAVNSVLPNCPSAPVSRNGNALKGRICVEGRKRLSVLACHGRTGRASVGRHIAGFARHIERSRSFRHLSSVQIIP